METEQFIFLGEPVEQAIIVRIWEEIRLEIASKYMTEHRWAHAECHKRRRHL